MLPSFFMSQTKGTKKEPVNDQVNTGSKSKKNKIKTQYYAKNRAIYISTSLCGLLTLVRVPYQWSDVAVDMVFIPHTFIMFQKK